MPLTRDDSHSRACKRAIWGQFGARYFARNLSPQTWRLSSFAVSDGAEFGPAGDGSVAALRLDRDGDRPAQGRPARGAAVDFGDETIEVDPGAPRARRCGWSGLLGMTGG